MPLLWQYVVHKIMELSGLPEIEFIKIVATYNRLCNNGKINDNDLRNRGYTEEQLKEVNKKKKVQSVGITSCGLRFSTSLESFDSEIFNYAFLLFENYERGVMPFEGTISEQPAQIIEIFGLIQNLRYEQDEKVRKKLEQESKRKR